MRKENNMVTRNVIIITSTLQKLGEFYFISGSQDKLCLRNVQGMAGIIFMKCCLLYNSWSVFSRFYQ